MHKEARAVEINNLSTIPLNNVDLILLDLDNTLYEYKKCHDKALGCIAGQMSKHFDKNEEQVRSLYMSCRKIVNTRHHGTAASHSRLFYLQLMIENLHGRTDVALVDSLHKSYWGTFINEMTLFSDAEYFLSTCLAQSIPMVLVTDMTAEIQFQKIKKLDIGKYFPFIVTSEEAGVEKPSPFIFELAIAKAETIHKKIKNILVIGDDQVKDTFDSPIYTVDTYFVNR